LKMPKLGTRNLYYLLKKELEILNVGRDKLFAILKANHMLTPNQMHKQKRIKIKTYKTKNLRRLKPSEI